MLCENLETKMARCLCPQIFRSRARASPDNHGETLHDSPACQAGGEADTAFR